MLRLRVLGQMDLRDPEGREVTAVLVQPKRLALLAYLAMTATTGFQRRDILLLLFWPELSEPRARNALRQAVHQLRRALGSDVVLSRGTDMLAVDESRLWCDARTFEAALARGALDEAVALYGGDLLPGFAVEGATEFNRWLDDTRVVLRRRAARAAWALADRRERAGDGPERSRAPDGRHHWGSTTRPDCVSWSCCSTAWATPRPRSRRTPPSRIVSSATPGRSRRAIRRRWWRQSGRAPGPKSTTPPASSPRVPDPPRVTIAPFVNLGGDPSSDFVGRLVCDAIADGLLRNRSIAIVTTDGSDGSSSAQPSVRLRRQRLVLSGGDTWRFQSEGQRAGGRVLDTVARWPAPRLQPWDAADELRRRVCGTLAGRFDPRFASLADAVAQAPDLDAHLELALGVELHLRGDFRTAIPHLLRAAHAREGFTLAALWAIQASCNLGEWEQAEAILTELTERSRRGRLSAFEQLACEFYTACLDGQQGAALRMVRQAAELAPASEVLSQLGRQALFCNQPRAAVETLVRLGPGQGWIPSWTPHWRRLTEAYHRLGEHERELDAAQLARTHHPEAISALLYESRAHAAVGNLVALSRCIDEACAFPPDRFADAGDVMLDAARELRAHGRAAEGIGARGARDRMVHRPAAAARRPTGCS